MMALFAQVVLALAQAQDAEFAEILKRFEADEPALREAASRDLDRYVKKLRDGGASFLRARIAETTGEVKGRLQNRLDDFIRVENAWKTLRPLDALDLPDLKDKKLVLYNIGSHWSGGNNQWGFQYEAGWLLEESKDQLRIFNLYGQTQTHARKFDPFKEWEQARSTWPKDRPLPTEYLEVAFDKVCARVCVPESSASRDDPFDSCFFPANGWGLHAALLARWALQRGDDRKAFELLEAGARAAPRDRQDKQAPYPEVLSLLVCGHLRTDALMSLEPRPALLKTWQKIRALAPNFREGEADRMIPAYEQLIAEDKAWKEPEKPEGADYWIHHLRDVAARQRSDPGSCQVLHPWHEDKKRDKPYPPQELVNLGWEALPAIIEHLDDTRPTRSVGWHRSFNPSSYYLLLVGDCCQQIFEAITGFDIYQVRNTSGAMVKYGDAPDAKAKARKWWAENKDKGPEQFFISALDKADMAGSAARKLLEMNAEKHFPRLIAILARNESAERNAILGPLGPHLKKEHQKLVEDAVALSHDPHFVSTATPILWEQFRSDRGALAVIEHLKAALLEDREPTFLWHGSWSLRRVRSDAVAAGLCGLMRAKNVHVRMEAFRIAADFPHPLLAAELVSQLGDTELTGWSSNFPIRFCDQAAETLCRIAALGDRFALSGEPEERDKTLQDLKKWWDKDGSAVDWKGLLQKLEEDERPVKK